MKIEQFRIKNFRAIGVGPGGEGITIKFADNNLIFLSGENNTGKSSVLVAYARLNKRSDGFLRSSPRCRRGRLASFVRALWLSWIKEAPNF